MAKPKFIRNNWYGFDHAVVDKKFSGQLQFMNSFTINCEHYPVAVYKAKNPDYTKGHKKYMLLSKYKESFIVRGMTPQQITKEKFSSAIHCHDCNDMITSAMIHDYNQCSCKNVSIDGGKVYYRYLTRNKNYTIYPINLLTGEIILTREQKFNKKLNKLVNE